MNSQEADFSEIQFKEAVGHDKKEVHPWRRYFARLFDITLFSAIAMVVLVVIGYVFAPEKTDEALVLISAGLLGKLVSGVASVLLALPGIAISQSLLGTPGKWLFGIKVRNSEGRRLSMGASFHRELLVAVKGMGFGIPIVTAVLMILSHIRLSSDGVTSWDKQLDCRVTHTPMNVIGYIKAAPGVVVVITVILYDLFSDFMPAAQ